MNQRELILDMLLEILENGQFSNRVIGDVLDKYAYLPKEERSFVTRVTQGVVERKLTLDYILNRFSKTPVTKMKPLIRNLMRSAVYQMVYMDQIPVSAVVNESVKLAGKRGFKGLAGFVNGVLRAIARSPYVKDGDHGKRILDEAGRSTYYSMPEWIIALWDEKFGTDTTDRMMEAFLQVPQTTAWFLADDGITVCDYHERPERSIVQDVSSMEAAILTGACKGKRVLDCCASPGGKSLYMKAMGAEVTSCDISEKKLVRIRENAQKMELPLEIRVQDATAFRPEWEGAFDIVLADVPCSGLGVLSRKPEIKYSLTPEKIGELVRIQQTILANVVRYVDPHGGTLVFSTCTTGTQENDGAALEKLVAEATGNKLKPVYEQERIPGRDPGDGFYMKKWQYNGV